MKMPLKLSLLFLIMFQASCSYKNNIKKVLNEERKTLQITNETKTPNADFFTASEATGAALGGIAGAVISSSGNNGIVDISHTEDPANYIKKNLAEILKSKYNLKIINGAKDVVAGDKILSNYGSGDLVLDANSMTVGSYYPFRLDRFRATYYVFVRMVDRKTESVIFKSTCKYDDKENNDNTLKEIAENPKVIATIFKSAREFCLKKFEKEILE
jgi:hypothetical protein